MVRYSQTSAVGDVFVKTFAAQITPSTHQHLPLLESLNYELITILSVAVLCSWIRSLFLYLIQGIRGIVVNGNGNLQFVGHRKSLDCGRFYWYKGNIGL